MTDPASHQASQGAVTPHEDRELLRRYAEENSEEAFAEFVRRNINLVYSAALRRTGGDAHAAADVAQQVFVSAARHARALSRHARLTGWLYSTTRNAALNLMRDEQRRQRREHEAHAANELLAPANPPADWAQLRPVLDAAMDELSDADREAVLLRFFEGRAFAEVGRRLNLAENTARMRVERALDKLRARLAKHGVTSTTGALMAVLANQAAAAAPAGLAATVAGAALSSVPIAAGAAATTVTAIFSMSTKTIVLAAVALAATGSAVYEFDQNRQTETALVAARSEREHWRTRASAAEQRAAQADQDLASLQGAIDSARAANANATARLAAAARNAGHGADASDATNTAIMTYLGTPVPPPTNMDPRYASQNLANVFTELSKTAGLEVRKLFVDDSEFPFIVYGSIAGQHDLSAIETALGTTAGFAYGGAVRESTNRGTYFALNMIPSRHQDDVAARRLMIRMQMLTDKAKLE